MTTDPSTSESPSTPGSPSKTPSKTPPFWAWLIVILCVIVAVSTATATVIFLRPWATQNAPVSSGDQKPATITKSPTPKTSKATPPSTAPAPVAIVLPSCETLWPIRYARAKAIAENYPGGEIQFNDFDDHQFSEHFGPASQVALGQVSQMRGCGYPASLETFTHAYISELSGSPRESLISALRADKDFSESKDGVAHLFVWEQPLDGGHWYAEFTTHMFIGDIWVAGYGSDPAADYVPTITAAILATNPTLS